MVLFDKAADTQHLQLPYWQVLLAASGSTPATGAKDASITLTPSPMSSASRAATSFNLAGDRPLVGAFGAGRLLVVGERGQPDCGEHLRRTKRRPSDDPTVRVSPVVRRRMSRGVHRWPLPG